MVSHKILSSFNFAIYAHAFNKDKTQLVVSPNSNEAIIYDVSSKGLVEVHSLREHNLQITSLDWAPNTNRIVTCSLDKTAYVWNYSKEKNSWKPTLVHLRFSKGATFVRWSPLENKFAVASSCKLVAICYFGEENDWYVSKHLKKGLESTVLTIDWHKDNILLATSSTDATTKIFSTYIKTIDEKPQSNSWGSKFPFNAILGDYSTESKAWIHDSKFSPNGESLAFVAHDSTLTVVYPTQESADIHIVITEFLPFTRLLWKNESSIITVGHDCIPVLFEGDSSSKWKYKCKFDDIKKDTQNDSQVESAFNKFKKMDSKGFNDDSQSSEKQNTVHQSFINELRTYNKNQGSVTSVSTSACDGKLVIWEI